MIQLHTTDRLALHHSERNRQIEQVCMERLARRVRRASQLTLTLGLSMQVRPPLIGLKRRPARKLAPVVTAEFSSQACGCTD